AVVTHLRDGRLIAGAARLGDGGLVVAALLGEGGGVALRVRGAGREREHEQEGEQGLHDDPQEKGEPISYGGQTTGSSSALRYQLRRREPEKTVLPGSRRRRLLLIDGGRVAVPGLVDHGASTQLLVQPERVAVADLVDERRAAAVLEGNGTAHTAEGVEVAVLDERHAVATILEEPRDVVVALLREAGVGTGGAVRHLLVGAVPVARLGDDRVVVGTRGELRGPVVVASLRDEAVVAVVTAAVGGRDVQRLRSPVVVAVLADRGVVEVVGTTTVEHLRCVVVVTVLRDPGDGRRVAPVGAVEGLGGIVPVARLERLDGVVGAAVDLLIGVVVVAGLLDPQRLRMAAENLLLRPVAVAVLEGPRILAAGGPRRDEG